MEPELIFKPQASHSYASALRATKHHAKIPVIRIELLALVATHLPDYGIFEIKLDGLNGAESEGKLCSFVKTCSS